MAANAGYRVGGLENLLEPLEHGGCGRAADGVEAEDDAGPPETVEHAVADARGVELILGDDRRRAQGVELCFKRRQLWLGTEPPYCTFYRRR